MTLKVKPRTPEATHDECGLNLITRENGTLSIYQPVVFIYQGLNLSKKQVEMLIKVLPKFIPYLK